MDVFDRLSRLLPTSAWSQVLLLSAVAAVILWRVFTFFYKERVEQLQSMLQNERDTSGHFKMRFDDACESADSELEAAAHRIAELEREVAMTPGEPVPDHRAIPVMKIVARGADCVTDGQAQDLLTRTWLHAGLVVGRQIRWRVWYRPSRVQKMLEAVAKEADPPRGRTDAVVFHAIHTAWDSCRLFGSAVGASVLLQVGVEFLKNPAAKPDEVGEYLPKAFEPRFDEVIQSATDTALSAFTIGVHLGMQGKEPNPNEEYVLEPGIE